MSTPGQLFIGFYLQAFDQDGIPLPGALLYTYTAGTTTPQDTFADSDLDPSSVNTNPVQANAGGYFPPIYLTPGIGYKFLLTDANAIQIYEQDNVVDPATLLFVQLAGTDGAKNVTSGYTITNDDQVVTVDSTGGANPCLINLPPATDRDRPLTIKNVGTVPLSIVRDGSDTIEGLSADFTVIAAVSPNFPTITVASDVISNWWITSSHGL